MTTRTEEEETEAKSELQTLLIKPNHAKIEVLTKDEARTQEALSCERLIRARKSLTRSQPIDESFEYTSNLTIDGCLQSPVTPISIAEEQTSECGSLDHAECDPEATSKQEDEVPFDNLSTSLSALRMEKFALEKRRVSRILPRCLHPTFVDPDVEHLFQVFHERQRRGDMRLLLIAGILLALYSFSLLLGSSTHALEYFPIVAFSIFAVLHLLLLCFLQLQRFPELGWTVVPYIVWLLCVTELLLLVIYCPTSVAPRQSLLWMLLLAFLYLAALPLRLLHALIMSATGSGLYVLVTALVQRSKVFSYDQVIGSFLLGTGATLLGLMSYFFADKKHRRAFLETRQSLEMKMVIEEELKEQERLLLSVLPKHVAETMRQDLGRGGDGQFKKIYMSRHENVSILFADIVGFTAISSTYTASELVKMLNELFARFDGLADKYKQLRIKILGDCYYCISGAPKERPDHAILSVHMGLSMIDAIKYVRETTGCGVDMRVGIHTGAVLAGVLGQRQWQFDVYSKDVILANKMESSGKPGRVHVSNTTKQFLNDHFEVEPAFGEKREDSLRAACLKTYFISKVLITHKPRPSLGMIKNGAKTNSSSQPSKENPSDNTMVSRDSVTLSIQEEGRCRTTAAEQGRNSFTKKLQRELVSRDGRKDLLNKISLLTLAFRDVKVETAFRQHRETFSGAATTSLPLILFIVALTRFIVLTRAGGGLLVFFLGFGLTAALTFVPAARSFPLPVCDCLLKISEWMHACQWRRSLCFSLLMSAAACVVMVDMYLCDKGVITEGMLPTENGYGVLPPVSMPVAVNASKSPPVEERNETEHIPVATTLDTYTDPLMSQAHFRNCTHAPKRPHTCEMPDYYTYFLLLILLASSLLSQMNYVFKNFMFFLAAMMQCLLNLSLMQPIVLSIFYCMDLFPSVSWLTESVLLSSQLCLITLLLIFLNRQMEKASRLLYLWRREVEEQKERAEEFRQRNEALVYNILPPHVATHFMGMKKKKHEELYSQSYEEVGVLFASMPNFGDFYSEDSVNNQGLECLRFLNEVISDFDGLLEKPQFNDIIKIKTIGSTYMATSGLNPPQPTREGDPIKVRWSHLALLVDFAFELIRAIQSINEQSFNHFVLRMGINHGPITAGVIGARKPHYDIWGNTVNVASRMESTGKAGCIQVTEETMKILLHFGYVFEQRGVINVKGKGELMTYYLIGKATLPPPVNVDNTIIVDT